MLKDAMMLVAFEQEALPPICLLIWSMLHGQLHVWHFANNFMAAYTTHSLYQTLLQTASAQIQDTYHVAQLKFGHMRCRMQSTTGTLTSLALLRQHRGRPCP